MAEAHRDCLLDIFEDLDAKEFGKFQWHLRNEGVVKKSKLDNADREQTIDAMVGTYDDDNDEILEVTKRILKKIHKNDLVRKLAKSTGTDLGSKGSAATLPNVTVPTEGAQKLKAVRDGFIDGISEANLLALLDKLLTRDVINDDEMEFVRTKIGKKEKARQVIDMVRAKGDKTSSDMIDIVRKLDPNLCQTIGL